MSFLLSLSKLIALNSIILCVVSSGCYSQIFKAFLMQSSITCNIMIFLSMENNSAFTINI